MCAISSEYFSILKFSFKPAEDFFGNFSGSVSHIVSSPILGVTDSYLSYCYLKTYSPNNYGSRRRPHEMRNRPDPELRIYLDKFRISSTLSDLETSYRMHMVFFKAEAFYQDLKLSPCKYALFENRTPLKRGLYK